MFKDPKTVGARIYVGNIGDNVDRNDLQKMFQKHGNIQGILHQKKFAFIQFTNENEANQAVEQENGSMIQNRKLMVRFAQSRSGNQNQGQNPPNQNQMQNQNQPMGGGGPGRNRGGNWSGNNQQQNNNNNDRDRSRSPMSAGDGRNNWTQNRNNTENFNSNRDNSEGFFGGPQGMARNNSNQNFGNNSNSNMPQQDFQHPDYNDCEIIVVSKALTSYAELVELQLKKLNLSVDLLFPNDEVPIGKVLANIASRGSLYGLLVTPQNEQHRSITVTQLYGDNPTEHRNMPVEEAVKFIYKDFQKKTNSSGPPNPQFPTAIQFSTIVQTPELKETHPEPIQILLNMLADNNPLTVLQYDRIIKYLNERKIMQVQAEIGEDLAASEISNLATTAAGKTNETPKVDPEVAKEEELQKKILEILNKPSLTESMKKVEEPKPKIPSFKIGPSAISTNSSATSEPPQSKLLKDEKVQKALDFLLLGKKF